MFTKIASLFNSNNDPSIAEVSESDALSVQLLNATQNPNPAGIGGGDISYTDGVLLSTGPVGAEEISAAKESHTGEISVYVVREGDALSQIAEMYGVTANTIMWANDLSSATSIRPGDTLIILPVAGVQHTVKSGETMASIVKKYEADLDEVLEYNHKTSEDDLVVGEVLIIPGGTVSVPKVTASRPTPTNGVSGSSVGLSHPLPGSVRSQGIHGYNGVDLARVPLGTTVRAAAAGEVIVAKGGGAWNGGYGNYVVIRHANGVQTLYAHLNSVDVVPGQYVSTGERLGGVGNSGRSTGVHLHFEVRGGVNPF
ncbi:M23 family metallopeptidase [Candidatus Kaiserbacteria bacterium]|nr:M23 family metallopeptidase [Candidatus Kaiserbacteria bacterium]